MRMASLIFNWKLVEAESRILKQSSEQRERQFSEPLRCLKMWEDLKSRVGLGPRILSLRVYDRESFSTSFHVQAVVPVILVKPIVSLPLAFVNILPQTNIFSPSSGLIIQINVSRCDTIIYCITSFYFVQLTMGWWFIRNMSWLNDMNFKNIVWFIKAIIKIIIKTTIINRGGWTRAELHHGSTLQYCFSLHELSCFSDLWIGDWRSVKIGISFFSSM